MSNTSVVKLGLDPLPLEVTLSTGADFDAVLTYKVSGVVTDWPSGTALALVFANGVTWTSTVSTSTATFSKDKADADAMPNGTGVKLRYTNSTTDRILMVGRVNRRD